MYLILIDTTKSKVHYQAMTQFYSYILKNVRRKEKEEACTRTYYTVTSILLPPLVLLIQCSANVQNNIL